ncbi:MAG: putative transrane protein [Rhodospirillales bacterium]|nr:putative transrane protein [Rhodospirillales bacterium]
MRLLAETILLPPGDFLVVFVLGLLVSLRWRRLGRALQIAAFLALYALSTPYVANRLLASLEPAAPLDMQRAGVAGAIVVLSADASGATPEYGSDTIGAMTLQRMRYAARLQRETGLPLLVTGGVPGQFSRPLAVMMAESFEADFGLTPRWVEDRAQTTADNAEFSAAMLKPDGVSTVLLVTSAWHMKRAMLAFAASRLAPIPAPTMFTIVSSRPRSFLPRLGALHNAYYALHEYLGIGWYRLSYALAGRP